MSELVRKSEAQEEQVQKAQIRGAAEHIAGLIVGVTVVAVLSLLAAAANSPQGKYSLKSPGGIALSDFKGYEDWAAVSSSHTDERLKVILGNLIMMNAFKAGIPGNNQTFPNGTMIVELQWRRHREPVLRALGNNSGKRHRGSSRRRSKTVPAEVSWHL